MFPSNVHINILRGLPCRLESLRLKFTNEPSIFVDGDLDESIKRSASDRVGDLVPQVRARTSPGVFRDMALLGLCLELSFNVLYCRTQANLPTLMKFTVLAEVSPCNTGAKIVARFPLFIEGPAFLVFSKMAKGDKKKKEKVQELMLTSFSLSKADVYRAFQ